MVTKTVINPGWKMYEGFKGFEAAVKVGDLLFISGIGAIDPEGSLVGKGDIMAQTRQVMENLKAVLEAAGGTLEDVTFTHTFMTDTREMFKAMEVMAEYFTDSSPITGTGVQIASLGLEGMMIEMSAIAVLQK